MTTMGSTLKSQWKLLASDSSNLNSLPNETKGSSIIPPGLLRFLQRWTKISCLDVVLVYETDPNLLFSGARLSHPYVFQQIENMVNKVTYHRFMKGFPFLLATK
jgi:hypothetical protein